MMKPEVTEIPEAEPANAEIEAQLEELASMISGSFAGGVNPATLNTLRELYDSEHPASARFVENLLHCAVCRSQWRCDLCQYRQDTHKSMPR